MTCVDISNISNQLPDALTGILELYAQFYSKTMACYPQFLEQVVEFWKSGQIDTQTITNTISYLIEKGLIYIT